MKCGKRTGGHVCPTQMTARIGKFGKVEWDCPSCDRREAGLCQRCPRPVAGTVGKALYCADCRKAKHNADSLTAYFREHDRNKKASRIRHRKLRTKLTGEPPVLDRAERGRRGGLVGGKARHANSSPDEWRAMARKGGRKSAALYAHKRPREHYAEMGRRGNAVRWQHDQQPTD